MDKKTNDRTNRRDDSRRQDQGEGKKSDKMMTLSPKQYLRKIRKQQEAVAACDETLAIIDISAKVEKLFGVTKTDITSNQMNPISFCVPVQPSGKPAAAEFTTLIRAAFESDVSQEKAEFKMRNLADGSQFSVTVWVSVVRFTGHKNLLQVAFREGVNSGIDINEFLTIDDEVSEFGDQMEFHAPSLGSAQAHQNMPHIGFEPVMDQRMDVLDMPPPPTAMKDYMTMMTEIFLTQVSVVKNHMHAASFPIEKRRVGLFRNGFKTNGIISMMPPSLEELFEVAEKRLLLPVAKRIFTIEGLEVFDIEAIMPEDHLYVSAGESFTPPTMVGDLNCLILYHEKQSEPYLKFENDTTKEGEAVPIDEMRNALNKPEGGFDFFIEKNDGKKQVKSGEKVSCGASVIILNATVSKSISTAQSSKRAKASAYDDNLGLKMKTSTKTKTSAPKNVAVVKGKTAESGIHSIIHSCEEILEKEQAGVRPQVSTVEKAMMKTLEDQVSSQFFEDYLAKNFTLHLLEFYLDCVKFESEPSVDAAQKIIRKYVDDTDNPITSSVGFDEVKKARKMLGAKEVEADMFSQSAKQVFSSLTNSGFSSFLHSYHFKALMVSFKDRGQSDVLSGNNALHRAVRTGGVPVIKDLSRKGFPLNIKNRAGETSLHLAVKSGKSKIVRTLLDAGADVNAQDNALNTPTHIAASEKSKMVLKALLEFNPDQDVKNSMQVSVREALANR